MTTMQRIDAMIAERYGHLIAQYDREPPKKRPKSYTKDYMRSYMAKLRAEKKHRVAE